MTYTRYLRKVSCEHQEAEPTEGKVQPIELTINVKNVVVCDLYRFVDADTKNYDIRRSLIGIVDFNSGARERT